MVLGLVALASSSAYLTRYCISVANTTIEADLGLTPSQMGYVFSAFNVGYLFFQVPAGAFGNRCGTRVSFPVMSSLWSVITLWTAAATSYVPLLASRVAFGAAQAGLTPNSAKVIIDWFPVSRRGFGSAAIGAAMSLGSVITMGLTARLLLHLDWRTVFRLYSLVGIVWAAGYYLLARSRPSEHPWVNGAERRLIEGKPSHSGDGTASEPVKRGLTWKSLAVMSRSLTMWGICTQSLFRAAGYIILVTWFPAFLEKGFGVTREEAGLMSMAPTAAVIVGTMLGGVVVDWLLRRTGSKRISRVHVATTALGLCSLVTLSASWTGSAYQLVAAVAAGAIFSGVGNPAAWAATMDVAGDLTAEVMGIMNMAGTLGALVIPVVLGYMIEDIEATGGDWNHVIYLAAGIYLAGSLSWLVVDPDVTVGRTPG
jgi:MFS family permease